MIQQLKPDPKLREPLTRQERRQYAIQARRLFVASLELAESQKRLWAESVNEMPWRARLRLAWAVARGRVQCS